MSLIARHGSLVFWLGAVLAVGTACGHTVKAPSPEGLKKREQYFSRRISISKDPGCYFECVAYGRVAVTVDELETRLIENGGERWIKKLRNSNLSLADQGPLHRGPRRRVTIGAGLAMIGGAVGMAVYGDEAVRGASRGVFLGGVVAWLTGLAVDFEKRGPNAGWIRDYNQDVLDSLQLRGDPDPSLDEEEAFRRQTLILLPAEEGSWPQYKVK
jgi:hypothetical protein